MARDNAFTSLGSTRSELEQAWRDRLEDAEVLLAKGRYAASIASGIYALEIRLKVLICDRLELDSLPKLFETHHLRGLLYMAGLARRLESERESAVRRNWDGIVLVSDSLNDLRYKPNALWTEEQSSRFLDQLRTPPNGVIPWLEKPSPKRRSVRSRKP